MQNLELHSLTQMSEGGKTLDDIKHYSQTLASEWMKYFIGHGNDVVFVFQFVRRAAPLQK
jgi:hypothetical protein